LKAFAGDASGGPLARRNLNAFRGRVRGAGVSFVLDLAAGEIDGLAGSGSGRCGRGRLTRAAALMLP